MSWRCPPRRAAADHHVLDAADDVEIPVLVHGGEIARVHPAGPVDRFGGPFGIIPIAKHDAIAARAEFAGRARRHDMAVAVHDLHLDMRMDASHRADAALERFIA